MTNPELPKPEAFRTTFVQTDGWLGGHGKVLPPLDYTTDQMRAYGEACYRAGMERAMNMSIAETEHWQALSDKGHGCKCGLYIGGAIREVVGDAIRAEAGKEAK